MYEFLGKLEDFLFDILGLALPGAIFLLILISPAFFIHYDQINTQSLQNSTLAFVHFLPMVIRAHWKLNSQITFFALVILSYLLGHLVKIVSITLYKILGSMFDNLLIPLMYSLYTFTRDRLPRSMPNAGSGRYDFKWRKSGKDILFLILDLVTFYPRDYSKDHEPIWQAVRAGVSEKLQVTNLSWYPLFKLSSTVLMQENGRSLINNYVAKYNLYRSLACIFIFTWCYFHYIFSHAANFIDEDVCRIEHIILCSAVLLWYTFHRKYLRYWTFCGNEALMSLYYFLNKEKMKT